MCRYSEEVGPDMRDFSGSNEVLPANVIKLDSGEGTDRLDTDDITRSTASLTATRRSPPIWSSKSLTAIGRFPVFRSIITTNDNATGN